MCLFFFIFRNEFQLSLNGKDALEIDDRTLREHDIVSGDLIKVLSEERKPQEPKNPEPPTASCSRQSETADMRSTQEASNQWPVEGNQNAGGADNQDIPMEDEDCIQDKFVNRYLNEPMLIRDSTAEQVPQTLRGAFSRVANVQKSHQAVVPVLHVIMTEVGFVEKVGGILFFIIIQHPIDLAVQ